MWGTIRGFGRETDGMTLELGMLRLFVLRRLFAGLVASRSWERPSLVGVDVSCWRARWPWGIRLLLDGGLSACLG